MSTKKKPVPAPAKKAASAAKPAAQTAAPAAAPKKARKPVVLKAPIVRAAKRAKLLDKNSRAMLKLVSNWQGEATEDQRTTNGEIIANLQIVTKLAAQILLDTDMLQASGFAPTGGRGGNAKEPLAAGTVVAIKEKHFNPALYPVNEFEVVLDAGKQVRIRPVGDLRAPQIDVNRGWLQDLSAAVDTDGEDEDNTEDDGTNEDET
jgi:hypothetical protein